MQRYHTLVYSAVIAILASCGSAKPTRSVSSGPTVTYVSAAPSAIAADSKGAWFAYGMNVNNSSGVGFVYRGAVTPITRTDPGFQVDTVSSAGETIWFGAGGSRNQRNIGEIGTADTGGLHTVAFVGEEPDDLAYDAVHKRVYFTQSERNEYGWLDDAGRVSLCKANDQELVHNVGGPMRVATSRGVTWVLDYRLSAAFQTESGCRRSKPVVIGLGGDHTDVPGMVVDDSGDLWILDRRHGTTIHVANRGSIELVPPPLSADLTSIANLNHRICISAHSPDYIACRQAARWNRTKLPVPGIVSAMTARGSNVWLAYATVESKNIGAVVQTSSVFAAP